MLQSSHLLDDGVVPGKVIYADDQFINQMLVKQHFQTMDIADKLITMNDGKDVVEYFEKYLTEIKSNDQVTPLQPVSLLLLDINMPILNGIDTLRAVKEIFELQNKTRLYRQPAPTDEEYKTQRPI